jgi:DNA-binding HxlR family transcriptional regulator
MDGRGDMAGRGVGDAVPYSVMRIANHDATKRFSSSFRRNLSGTLAKTLHPKTRNLDASGVVDVSRVSETPPKRPTTRLHVRLKALHVEVSEPAVSHYWVALGSQSDTS